MGKRRLDTEFAFNVLLSVSIAAWALIGLFASETSRPLLVRGCITALHLVVAIQVLLRQRLRQSGTYAQLGLAVPALLIGGWIFFQSPIDWDLISQTAFVVGTLIACISFLYLGPSFSILPAVRAIVTQGPYSIVRHPAYLGELIMVAGCCLATKDWLYLALFLAALILVLVRILAEERLLAGQTQYCEYQSRVRYRLVPRIW